MKKLVLLLMACTALLGPACKNKVTGPSITEVITPDNPIRSRRPMSVSNWRVSGDSIWVEITGNIRLGMERQPELRHPVWGDDSLAGGQIELRTTGCPGDVRRYTTNYAHREENDDNVTVFRDFKIGSCNNIKYEVWVYTAFWVLHRLGGPIQHTLNSDFTRLNPTGLRVEGRNVVGRMDMLPSAAGKSAGIPGLGLSAGVTNAMSRQ
jgi:hypothetical protein